jgi:hypothetical protein
VKRVARRAMSIAGLTMVVLGLPAALVGFVGWPLPRGWPGIDEVRAALENGWNPGEEFVLGALAILAWVLWAQLLRHVVVQFAAQRRALATTGQPQPADAPRHGLLPRVAGWLVGGLLVAAPMVPSAALAAEQPRIPVVLSETRALDDPLATAPTSAVVSPTPDEPAAASYVVRTWDEQRDCLWNIAERYLGDGLRWGELLTLNATVAQPSGRPLVDDPQRWVYPGMELRLPADAAGPDLRRTPSPEATPARPAADADAPSPPPAPASTIPSPAPALTVSPPTTVTTAAPSSAPVVPSNAVTSAPPTSPRVRGTNVPDPIPLGNDVMRIVAALGLGLPIFAAGGIALRLNRRRRAQVARHRPGRDIVYPDRALEPLERRLRAIAADEAAEWIDATVRVLGTELRESSLPAPQVTCVRAGEFGLEILLAEASFEAPASFAAVDDGHVWRLDADVELADLQRRAGDHVSALPALVSLGASAEGPLLVDLEALGTLSVEGDGARVAAFLAGAALELASAPWAEGIDLRVVAGPPALSVVEGVTEFDDVASLTEELAVSTTSIADALGARPSTLAARLDEAGEDWPPTVVIVGGPEPLDGVEELAALATAGSGVALVAPGPVQGARWRLSVVADGFARLEPLGLAVRVAGMEALESSIASLDEEAIDRAASLLAAASHDEDVAPLVELGAEGPRPGRRPRPRSHHDVWVDVLGPVEVTGWAEPIGRHRKLEELVVFLASQEQRPVPGEEIRCAVWPDTEIGAKGFVQAVSRTRRHLGGRAHLPEAAGGAYRLGPGVGYSWTRFQELASAAARANPTQALSLWSEALDLVRGEPFAGVAKGTYVWAWSRRLVYEMQVSITRAADALGTLALAQDDPDTASWATRQGLLAMPQQLSLFDWEMRVAAHRRDLDGLNSAFQARRRAEQALDPLAEVPVETVELYESLLADLRGRRRSEVGS